MISTIPAFLKDLIEQVLAAYPGLFGPCTSSVRKQQIFAHFRLFAETIWAMIGRRRLRQQKRSISNDSGPEETLFDEVYYKFMRALYYFLVGGQRFCSWYAFFFGSLSLCLILLYIDQFIDYVIDCVWPEVDPEVDKRQVGSIHIPFE
ncbi:hypothetical protein [Absidia glauca]|uniref:Uncharacterized protein n=1 Tax=Absidia glauca TaxID=4829 RepID=A0A163JGK7_ABSGL|nr:hypothetical protein [Absidia glauca]